MDYDGEHLTSTSGQPLNVCGYCPDITRQGWDLCSQQAVTVFGSTKNKALYPACEEHAAWARAFKKDYLVEFADSVENFLIMYADMSLDGDEQ